MKGSVLWCSSISTVFSLPAPAVSVYTWYSYKNILQHFSQVLLRSWFHPMASWLRRTKWPAYWDCFHFPIYSVVIDFTRGGLVVAPSTGLWGPSLFRRFSAKGALPELAYHNPGHLPNCLTFLEMLFRTSCFCVRQQTFSFYEQAFQKKKKKTCTLAAVTLSRRKTFSLTWQDPLTNSSRKSSRTTLLTQKEEEK